MHSLHKLYFWFGRYLQNTIIQYNNIKILHHLNTKYRKYYIYSACDKLCTLPDLYIFSTVTPLHDTELYSDE